MDMRKGKLTTLAEEYGSTVDELVEDYALGEVAPGICMNDGCDYAAEYEPDQREGWCECCETRSVASALVLAGVI